MKAVRIRWTDACVHGTGEWLDPTTIDPGCEIVTVGLLVAKTKTHYVVTHSVAESGDVRGAFSIPRVNVIACRRLR